MNFVALGAALTVLFVGLVLMAVFSGRKKAWYKVYLANNDVRLMYRSWRERWRSTDKSARFRGDNGNEITFPAEAHWILMYERIPDSQVELVRLELMKLAQERRKTEEE